MTLPVTAVGHTVNQDPPAAAGDGQGSGIHRHLGRQMIPAGACGHRQCWPCHRVAPQPWAALKHHRRSRAHIPAGINYRCPGRCQLPPLPPPSRAANDPCWGLRPPPVLPLPPGRTATLGGAEAPPPEPRPHPGRDRLPLSWTLPAAAAAAGQHRHPGRQMIPAGASSTAAAALGTGHTAAAALGTGQKQARPLARPRPKIPTLTPWDAS